MSSVKIDRAGDYLTLDAACKKLEVPQSTLEYLIRRDAITTYRIGYTRLIKQADVEALLQARKEAYQ